MGLQGKSHMSVKLKILRRIEFFYAKISFRISHSLVCQPYALIFFYVIPPGLQCGHEKVGQLIQIGLHTGHSGYYKGHGSGIHKHHIGLIDDDIVKLPHKAVPGT